MIPSIQTILKTGCDGEVARKIRKLFEGKLNPREVSEKCDKWVSQCHNEPSEHEQILCAVDDLLGNHGVESLEIGDEHYSDSGVRMCPKYSYSNTGDSYALTVIRDHENERWLIASWGDLAEKDS